jgi:cytochrome c
LIHRGGDVELIVIIHSSDDRFASAQIPARRGVTCKVGNNLDRLQELRRLPCTKRRITRRQRADRIVIGTMRLIAACAFVAFIAAAYPFVIAEGKEPVDPRALLTHYKCYICHADRETKAGPAYVDVAAQYRKTPDAVSVIALEIRRGLRHGGPWHMPPHPEVSVAEARAMARYIVSLRP